MSRVPKSSKPLDDLRAEESASPETVGSTLATTASALLERMSLPFAPIRKKRSQVQDDPFQSSMSVAGIIADERFSEHASRLLTAMDPSRNDFAYRERRQRFGARNTSAAELFIPGLGIDIERRFGEIISLGLEADFEDGILSSFDEELDAFLTDDTAKRILFAWSVLQGPIDQRYMFYRFLERLGYSDSVSGELVPEGLLQSALQASVPGVRAAAAHALGNLGDAASLQSLRKRSLVESNQVVAEIINRHLQDYASSQAHQE